jgi:hypothetical protein
MDAYGVAELQRAELQRSGDQLGRPTYTAGCRTTTRQAVGSLLMLAIAVVLLMIAIVAVYVRTDSRLSSKLVSKGWTVYYRAGCRYCVEQKKILRAFPRAVNCGGSEPAPAFAGLLCGSPVITGYPFWYNTRTKEHRAGLQSRAALERLAGM